MYMIYCLIIGELCCKLFVFSISFLGHLVEAKKKSSKIFKNGTREKLTILLKISDMQQNLHQLKLFVMIHLPFQGCANLNWLQFIYSIHSVNILNRIYSHKVLIKPECIRGKNSYFASDGSISVQQG